MRCNVSSKPPASTPWGGETALGNRGEDRQKVLPARVFILLHCPHLLVVENNSRRQALAYFEAGSEGVQWGSRFLCRLRPDRRALGMNRAEGCDVAGGGTKKMTTRAQEAAARAPALVPCHWAQPRHAAAGRCRMGPSRLPASRLQLPSRLAGAERGRSCPTFWGGIAWYFRSSECRSLDFIRSNRAVGSAVLVLSGCAGCWRRRKRHGAENSIIFFFK